MFVLQAAAVLLISVPESSGAEDYKEIGDWTLVARDEYLTITGDQTGSGFASSIAAGDIDGDGRDDIIVGMPTYSGNDETGVVLIYFARDLDDIFPIEGTSDADVIVYGADPRDRFGANIAVGDMSGDGRDEIIISAKDADGIGNARRDSGEVYIIAGRARSQFQSRIWIEGITLYGHIYGRDAIDQIGQRMVVGDINGDGLEELVLGTNGAGGFGGTGDFHQPYENNAPGSWEIEVIQGKPSRIGDIILERDEKMVRYFSSYNSTLTPPDTHAMSIGKGMDLIDIDGDDHRDLVFSWTRWELNTPMSTQIEVISGGPSFPYVPLNTTIDIIIPSFSPNMTIELNDTILEPPKIAGGDLDGDQYQDLAVGAHSADDITGTRADAGQTWIMRGFDHSNGEVVYLDAFDSAIFGEDSSDMMGENLLLTDVDNDGFDELFIGAPKADGVRNLYTSCGEGYRYNFDGVFPETLTVLDSDKRYMGSEAGIGSFSLMISMDINDDGSMELLVSSPHYMDDSGSTVGLVSMFMERQEFEIRIFGGEDNSAFGSAVVMDDFNNDGFKDIVIGDPQAYTVQDGGAYLFFGSGSWGPVIENDKDVDIVYNVDLEGNQGQMGSTLAAGDLNDDGYPDVIVGSPFYYDGANNCGAVDIFWGGTASYMASKNHRKILGSTVEMVGSAITVGDFNGDSIDDLAISAPSTTSSQSLNRYHAGNVFIFLGPLSGTGSTRASSSADAIVTGSIANEQIGETLAAGDVDNDGIDDIIIGAPYSDVGSITDQGAVYIVQGRSSWPARVDLLQDISVKILGPWPFDQVGDSLASEDLDDDGHDEVIIGSPNGDGYQRTTPQGGNVYILFGDDVAKGLDDGATLSLRDQYNITIFGDTVNERVGSSVAVGDIDGDGDNDLAIGATGWKDLLTGSTPGAVMILYSNLLRDKAMLNSSSLPVVTSKGDGDSTGDTVAIGNITGDEREDLLIGTPSLDPYGDGDRIGGAILWEGKDLFYRDIKVSTARLMDVDGINDPLGERRSMQYINPKSGPYVLRLSGRSLSGYQDVVAISAKMTSLEGVGQAEMIFNTATESFSIQTSGVYQDKMSLDISNCSGMTDGVESWFIDIAFHVDWDTPDPDMITTYIEGMGSSYTNYLSREFRIDRTVRIDGDSIEYGRSDGMGLNSWARNTTEIELSNITLYHSITGKDLSHRALEDIQLALYRPDRRRMETSYVNDTTLNIPSTPIGEGLSSDNARFHLGPDPDSILPPGAEWTSNLTFFMKVDTYSPPEVSSFVVFPDGKEKGTVGLDDDRFVEVYWENVFDIGSSGIERYKVEVFTNDTEPIYIYDPVERGDLITVPEGDYWMEMTAYDNAGNPSDPVRRDLISDTSPPVFYSSSPSDGSWLTSEDEELSIMVTDGGAGIDIDSATYRIYRADAALLGEWQSLVGWEETGDDVKLIGSVPDQEGFGHYVQWRIADLAGHYSISSTYSFNKDITPPRIEPATMELLIGPDPYTFEAFIEDQLSWLDLSTIEFRLASGNDFQDAPWQDLGLQGFRVSSAAELTVDPDFEGIGLAQWRAADRAGNLAESDLIRVTVDRTLPEFRSFKPNSSSVQTKRTVEVSSIILETGSGLTIEDVEVSVSTVSGWVQYGVGGYSPWVAIDEIEDLGGSYEVFSEVHLDEGPFNLIRFRARDQAGNGWVVSTPLSVNVELPQVDLAPTAAFTMFPVADLIYSGESITLNGSASLDPEGGELTYAWYSDLEGYPGSGLLGTGMEINATLKTPGVHNIWLIVSDGTHTISSEKSQLRVELIQGDDEEEKEEDKSLWDSIMDSLLFILLALLVGIMIGAALIYLFFNREPEQELVQEQKMVDAVYDDDHVVPYCPYCSEEVRITDEYCIKCGSVFTEKDKTVMLEGRKPKKRSKKKKSDSLKPGEEDAKDQEEDSEVEEDWDIPLEDDEIEGDFFAEEPDEVEEDEIDLDEEDLEEYDEGELEEIDVEELEDLDDMEFEEDLDDDDWGVEE